MEKKMSLKEFYKVFEDWFYAHHLADYEEYLDDLKKRLNKKLNKK